MIDHMGVEVGDIEKSKRFYTEALAPLGYQVQMDFGEAVGFGTTPKPTFWIGGPSNLWPEEGERNLHVAFAAKSKQEVDDFYRDALRAGGRDNGKPGFRPEYHPGYYGAFVLDPDGYNIEAVYHDLEMAKKEGGR